METFNWQALAFVLAFLAGLASMLKYFLMRFDKKFDSIDRKFDKIDERFNSFENRMDDRFEKVDQRFEKVDQRFDALIKNMDARFDKMDERLNRIEHNTHDMNIRVSVAEMRLEERKAPSATPQPLAISQRRRRGPNKPKGGPNAKP